MYVNGSAFLYTFDRRKFDQSFMVKNSRKKLFLTKTIWLRVLWRKLLMVNHFLLENSLRKYNILSLILVQCTFRKTMTRNSDTAKIWRFNCPITVLFAFSSRTSRIRIKLETTERYIFEQKIKYIDLAN